MRVGVRIVAMVLALAMSSCLAPQNCTMVSVDIESWSTAESLTFQNCDTVSLRDLNIAVRYNDNFKSSTLPLKVAITTPDARYFEESVDLQLRHPSTALTVATTESLPYRNNVLLNQQGYYIFTFEPLCEVKGLEAIGIEFN